MVGMGVALSEKGRRAPRLHVSLRRVAFTFADVYALSPYVLGHAPQCPPEVGSGPSGRAAPKAPARPAIYDGLVVNPYHERWQRKRQELDDCPQLGSQRRGEWVGAGT
eukprot:6692911-Heterocapsa_arctica.AAC.1